MNRECKECGGIVGSVLETTCSCILLRVDMRDGKQFIATQTELRAIIDIMENGLSAHAKTNLGLTLGRWCSSNRAESGV